MNIICKGNPTEGYDFVGPFENFDEASEYDSRVHGGCNWVTTLTLPLSSLEHSHTILEHSHWDEDPDYPAEDWRYEVSNNDTRLGYHDWVTHQKESSN